MKALIDLHTHTIVSGHAYSTIKENVEAASKAGLKYIGLSEHAPNMPASPHAYYFQNVHVIPKEIDGVRVIQGIEANIIDYDGNIDVTKIATIKYQITISGTLEEFTTSKELEEYINTLPAGTYKITYIVNHLNAEATKTKSVSLR